MVKSRPDLLALDVLIAASERRVGRQSAAVRNLMQLRAAPSEAAFNRARDSFDAMPPEMRLDIASTACSAAENMRRSGLDRVVQKLGLIGALNRRR